MKCNQEASIVTLFPRALYPGKYFYLFSPHFPSFGRSPETKSLCFSFEVSISPGIPLVIPLFLKTLSANASHQPQHGGAYHFLLGDSSTPFL